MTDEISGILVVDKPMDMSSARVISRIKKISGINKAGHTGTLDPMATGVMICTVNRATRLSRFFLNSSKTYEAVLKLGVETDTLDATGRIVATSRTDTVSDRDIRETCKQFEGEISQVPPVYSALKHNGVPLYKYARNGTPVVKPPRKVFISYIKLLEINLPDVRFEAKCSSGTYIRTLCADMGRTLRCGGHLKSLRRTECGGFSIDRAVALQDIESHRSLDSMKEQLIPMADALLDMKTVIADDRLTELIKYGKQIPMTDSRFDGCTDDPYIKVIHPDRRLLAVVSPDENKNIYNYCCVFCNP